MNFIQRSTTALSVLITLAPLSGFSAATLPAWYNAADATHTHLAHLFTTDDLTPAPDSNINSNGTPVTTVNLGGFNDGWQEPNTIDQSGADIDPGTPGRQTDGAWDLGVAGSIQSEINIAPSAPLSGMFYEVKFQVYAIALDSLQRLPELEVVGHTAGDLTRSEVAVDGPTTLSGYWKGITWTGTLQNVNTDQLTFSFNVPTDVDSTSIIDSYEIFTSYTVVPEPSTSMMLLGSALVLVSRRKRRA